jgi:hypothetical protein
LYCRSTAAYTAMLAGVAGTGRVAAFATTGIPSPKMKQSPARSGAQQRLMDESVSLGGGVIPSQ